MLRYKSAKIVQVGSHLCASAVLITTQSLSQHVMEIFKPSRATFLIASLLVFVLGMDLDTLSDVHVGIFVIEKAEEAFSA